MPAQNHFPQRPSRVKSLSFVNPACPHLNQSPELVQLLARVALRDRVAFAALYNLTSAKLFGVILRLTGNRAEAEDALQETFVKIWDHAASYRDTQHSPMAWLVAVARNHAIDRLRRAPKKQVELDDELGLADVGPTPEAATIAASTRRQIDNCLETIDTAAAIRGAYLDGYSYEELAKQFEVPLNTMKTWLRRGLLKLRDCIENGAR
jgi:RNA polymerase sigma-70 factor, ECF subfamily